MFGLTVALSSEYPQAIRTPGAAANENLHPARSQVLVVGRPQSVWQRAHKTIHQDRIIEIL